MDNETIDIEGEAVDVEPIDQPKKKSLVIKIFFTLIVFTILAFICGFILVSQLNQPSKDFPVGEMVVIEEGTSVREITSRLEAAGVVKSKHLLYYSLVLFHEPTRLKASNYLFDEPITTTMVASKLAEGDFDTDLVSFIHFEGERVTSIATRAESILPEFSADNFIALAEPYEGRLFPDTYYLPPSFTAKDLFRLMLETFTEKLEPYQAEIENHPLTEDEVINLASIIEREANTLESMKLVSSVLQNRLDIDMALQADASIEYVLEKPLSELTPADLEMDSPYNTYLYRGLPPTPIGNPGIDSIEAVLRPTPSDYLFYITDNTGTFHFAETYDEHLTNIDTYLR